VNRAGANSIGTVQHAAATSSGLAPARPAMTWRPSRIQATTISANPPYTATSASIRPCP
jgi:hypothetical protein